MFQTKKSNSFSKKIVKIFLQILSEFFQLIKKGFSEEIKGKETRYPFMIENTYPARKPREH